MPASPHVAVQIDLTRLRDNARAVKTLVGVDLLAVVKTDAYGLGAVKIIPAIDDLVNGYCFFSFGEAVACDFRSLTKKTGLTIGPAGGIDPQLFHQHRIRPAVWNIRDATLLTTADPILSVETGQQRFACPPADIEAVLKAGTCREAMTHATRPAQVARFIELVGGRGLRLHAAGSSLLDDPQARLDAVRPGLALYRGAVCISTRLIELHDSTGPAGYTGFVTPRHGIILCGYSHGLRPGPCLVNGQISRVIEVGMQSAFVECAAGDRVGDEVMLLGNSVTEEAVAAVWGTTPHNVLVQLSGAGERTYA